MSDCRHGRPECECQTFSKYTGESLRTVTLCEETGVRARPSGVCPIHGGDACLYVYQHPYDNAVDRWKRPQWGNSGRLPEG